MTDEEKELLARIGRVAGQINRHKNQQNNSRSPSLQPTHHRGTSADYSPRGGPGDTDRSSGSTYRHNTRAYPYPTHRAGRAAAPHRHRTLQLNGASTPATGSGTDEASSDNSAWVSRTDRHRQLINADVYAKQSQDRAKAIEQTRQRSFKAHKQSEKARFNQFLAHQNKAVATTPGGAAAVTHEIVLEGVSFRVMPGGKKLVRLPGDANFGLVTPKSVLVAGVKFRRTKTGNLVANRVVKDQRRTGVFKVDQLCKIFSMTGSCQKGSRCRYVHDAQKVAVCKDFLKDGRCPRGDACDLSHELTPERVPDCLHFAKGHCAKADCPYTHSKAPAGALVCHAFGFYGYCEKGSECMERHVFECPDFSNTGRCKIRGCKLPHRERASVLRNRNKDEDSQEDVSSDEEAADSGDVDSDDVAEFIEADSDDSDFENSKDYIPL